MAPVQIPQGGPWPAACSLSHLLDDLDTLLLDRHLERLVLVLLQELVVVALVVPQLAVFHL